MKDEVFDLEVEHQHKQIKITVKTDLPVGPEPFGADYDIYLGRKLWYVLNHCKNDDDVQCWEIRKSPKEGADEDLVAAIGKAIDRHYS